MRREIAVELKEVRESCTNVFWSFKVICVYFLKRRFTRYSSWNAWS